MPRNKGLHLDNINSGTKGEPRQQDGRLTMALRMDMFFSATVITLFFHISLCWLFGSHAVHVLWCDGPMFV